MHMANSGRPPVDESDARTDVGLVDLTDIPLDALDSFDESVLASSEALLLRQLDHPSSSVGGHNS
jgi:hypothetical protein